MITDYISLHVQHPLFAPEVKFEFSEQIFEE